MFQNVVILIT